MFGWLFGKKTARPRLMRPACKPDTFPMKVVGESYCQDVLKALCGGYSRGGHHVLCDAILVPEPTNAHDANAVMVTIQGEKVGYLPGDQAIRWNEAVTAAGATGKIGCKALINGGWKTNQHDSGHFGVKLAIPTRGPLTFS